MHSPFFSVAVTHRARADGGGGGGVTRERARLANKLKRHARHHPPKQHNWMCAQLVSTHTTLDWINMAAALRVVAHTQLFCGTPHQHTLARPLEERLNEPPPHGAPNPHRTTHN